MSKLYNYYNRFIEKHFGGHINIGRKITIYGHNAMHWGVNISTKKYGYICFRLPFTTNGKFQPLYLYFSPNGTPWSSTYYKGKDEEQQWKSILRKKILGHNFNSNDLYDELREINDSISTYNYLQKIKRKIITEKFYTD